MKHKNEGMINEKCIADHILLISPSAYFDFSTNTTEGELLIAKCKGSFIRKVVFL